MRSTIHAAVAALALLLAGCAASTRFSAPSPGATLELLDSTATHLPREERLASKATGQHEFKATGAGGEVLYGILPLRVNGGKMATSILLFAPALFGGFRDVFAEYEIDPVARVIRYRSKADEEWRVYTPTSAEIARGEAALEAR